MSSLRSVLQPAETDAHVDDYGVVAELDVIYIAVATRCEGADFDIFHDMMQDRG